MELFSGDRVIDAGSDPVGADSASSGSAPADKSHAHGEMTLPPLPPIELPFIRKEPPPAPAPDASAMERILGPVPALPVALATPTGTLALVPRAGAPDSTPVTTEASAVESASNSALELNLRALRPILSDPEVTELCINRPGEAFVETAKGWERRALPFADFDWCRRFAKLIANSTHQRIDESTPLLSASLPTGERAQIVLSPATTAGTVAITLRRPSEEVWSIDELARRGIFRSTRRSTAALDDTERELLRLLTA